MSLIEAFEIKPLSIKEAEEFLLKYQVLYVTEKDKSLSDEYYEVALYLEARIEAMKAENEYIDNAKSAQIEDLQKENDILFKRVINENEKALTKKDIMIRFDKESAWALNLLKLLFQMNLARKIGKEYFTTKEELEEFVKHSKGKDFII